MNTFGKYLAWRIAKQIGIVLTFSVRFTLMLIGLIVLWPIVRAVDAWKVWIGGVRCDYENRKKP